MSSQANRRMRPGVVLITALIVALIGALIAGYFVREHLAKTKYGPQGRVEHYLQALVDGRASDAIDILDPDATTAERALLTDEVYRNAEMRPTDWDILDVQLGERSATVAATLTMDAKRYPLSFQLRKAGTKDVFFDNWAIDDGPRQHLTVAGAPATVNGASIPSASGADAGSGPDGAGRSLAVLPGSYTFAPPTGTDNVTYGEPVTVVVLPGGNPDGVPHVAFSASWTQAAKDQAIAKVKERIAGCMSSNRFRPAGCENVLEMRDPGYAVTAIARSWAAEPSYEFEAADGLDGAAVTINGGELRIDYKWRFTESDTWEPDQRTQRIWGGTRVPVTIGDDGSLQLDFSSF